MGKVSKALLVVFVVLIVVLGGAVYFGVFQRPSVSSVDLEWGEVSEDTTEVIATVEVNNSNPFGYGFENIDLSYDVSINDVELGSGVKRGVELEKGSFPLEVVIELNNSRLDQWWVSHLKNDESSVVNVDSRLLVDLFFTEVEVDVPDVNRSFETDLLGNIDFGDEKEVGVGNETFLVVDDVGIEWGNVSENRSMIDSEVVFSNPNNYSVPLLELRYSVFMNDVLVGEGVSDSLIFEGGSSDSVDASIVLNHSVIDDWWVRHLRNGEKSEARVEVVAVISALGEEIVVPVGSFNSSFGTDIL